MYRMALYLRPNIFASKILSSYIGTKIESGTVEYRATVQTRASGKNIRTTPGSEELSSEKSTRTKGYLSVRSPATTSLRADSPTGRPHATEDEPRSVGHAVDRILDRSFDVDLEQVLWKSADACSSSMSW